MDKHILSNKKTLIEQNTENVVRKCTRENESLGKTCWVLSFDPTFLSKSFNNTSRI